MNLRFLMLAIAVGASSPPDCLGGVCGDPQQESSVLMQRLNRKGRQMPLKVAAQATPSVEQEHKERAAELYETVVELLKADNTTKPVLLFVQDILRSLEEMIFPALKAGHAADQRLLDEAMNTFHMAESTFEMQIANFDHFVQQEQQASHVFDVCRDDDEQKCDAWSSCETERVRRWTIYEEIEVEYKAVVETIKYSWCEESNNRSEVSWRESTERRFEHFMSIGETRITKLEAHDEWATQCEESSQTLNDAVTVCAERKRDLEVLSCQRLAAYTEATTNLDNAWRIAKSSFSAVVATIKGKECYRASAFKFLQSIKCILVYLLDRCKVGSECDRPEGENEVVNVLAECNDYWKTEEAQTIHSLSTLHFPPVPVKPVAPEVGLIPCSGDYVSTHYPNMDGVCFASMPGCLPCGVAPSPSPSPSPGDHGDVSDEELNDMAEAACGGD